MVGMMKQNMAMIVPNMLMMGWVSYFFSGFVLVKLPFTLTDRFKSMLQRGVAMQSLDVSYVSSLSWYFLNLFGLRGLFTLVLGSDSGALDNTEVMAQQMQGGMQQPQDTNKLFESHHARHAPAVQPHTHHQPPLTPCSLRALLWRCAVVGAGRRRTSWRSYRSDLLSPPRCERLRHAQLHG